MASHTHHPSDETLLRAVDRELSPQQGATLERHLAECGSCTARRQELQGAAEEFLRACRTELMAETSAADGLRERVRANVRSLSAELDRSWRSRFARGLAAVPRAALAAAALVAMVSAAAVLRHRSESLRPDVPSDEAVVAVEPGVLPVRALTPGAIRPVHVDDLCAGRESTERPIPMAVRQAVLRDYRMEGVPAHEYELDYLITPELGGSGDRRNLWPERYAARVWNARVKDELERLLPAMVCQGQVDLTTAQQDIAANWIAAYKKYFRTDRPVGTQAGVVRDGVRDGPVLLESRYERLEPAAAWPARSASTLVLFVARARPMALRDRR